MMQRDGIEFTESKISHAPTGAELLAMVQQARARDDDDEVLYLSQLAHELLEAQRPLIE